MKKQIVYFILLGIASLFSSCELFVDAIKDDSVDTIVYDINAPITKLLLNNDMDLELIESEDSSLIINGAKQVLDDLVIKNDSAQISLKYKSSKAWMYDKPQVQLRLPKICDIELQAYNNVFANDTIRTEEFEITSTGTGDVKLLVNCRNLTINANYICNYYISGKTEKLSVYTTFGSIFNGANLVANHVRCKNEGSNHQIVHPVKSLACDMLLTGNVYYVNQPEELLINRINNSSGKVIFDNSKQYNQY